MKMERKKLQENLMNGTHVEPKKEQEFRSWFVGKKKLTKTFGFLIKLNIFELMLSDAVIFSFKLSCIQTWIILLSTTAGML